MKAQHITPAQAKSRVITPDEMVSCNLAFIDYKLPGSHLKHRRRWSIFPNRTALISAQQRCRKG